MSAIRSGANDCNGFEPQNYLRDRCKKCFRLKAKHVTAVGSTAAPKKPPPSAVGPPPRRPATICAAAAATVGLMAPSASSGSGTTPATPSTPSGGSSSPPFSPTTVPLNVTVSASRVSHNNDHNNNKVTTISVQNYNNRTGNNVSNNNNNKTRSPRNSLGGGGAAPAMTTSLVVGDQHAPGPPAGPPRPKSMTGSASIDSIVNENNNKNNNNSLTSSASFGKKERRRSWRDRNSTLAVAADEGPDYDDAADSISLASYKTANSKGAALSSTKSTESVNSTTADSRSMVTAMSGGSVNDDERAVTPTDVTEFLDRDIMALRKENTRLQDQVLKLKNERQRWTRLRRRSRGNLEAGADALSADSAADERLAEAESLLQEYREENSLLKSEMRALQESTCPTERLHDAERRCEELAQKNSDLQRNVDELQQEIEEMQDQYREEEIDEFRELQRDLEQNAKNCRILQFKLRKSERQREQLAAEKHILAAKLRELQTVAATSGTSGPTTKPGAASDGSGDMPGEARFRELESELRIAKEVSVRLHNELETAEDKRFKLEDEIFYYKEKLRELQTQNKWRETRNRVAEKSGKRQDEDETAGDLTKELRDILERETDLREQLKFTEEDLHRTQNRLKEAENENEELLQKLVKLSEGKSILAQVNAQQQPAAAKSRAPMLRSFSEDSQRGANGEACRVGDYLRAYTLRADGKPYKTFAAADKKSKQTDSTSGARDFSVENVEMEKDIEKLLRTIHELEQRNGELQVQLQRSEAKLLSLQNNQHNGAPDSRGLAVELRKEQEKRKELQTELVEFKQLVAKSDNNKLIAMATKVEILSNQLKALNERCESLHKKSLKDVKDEKYTDELKARCDMLERQLAEQTARQTFQPHGGNSTGTAAAKAPTADEIEHCCALLASVDAQANRIAKHLDKIDTTQKEERRRSLSKDTYATVVTDLASVMAELKVLHKLLETHKAHSKHELNASSASERARTDAQPSPAAATFGDTPSCGACVEKAAVVDAHRDEIVFYKKKNKELTNQILQTEDRWTAEIERQSADHQAKIEKLKAELKQLQATLREQTQMADAQAQAFGEKDRLIDELGARLRRADAQIAEKQRAIQELEKEQRELKEWEIRHKKLESLYNKEKEKFDAEKTRIKADTAALKKRTDDALAELTRLRDGHQRREILWTEERARLEQEIAQLKARLARDPNNSSSNNIDHASSTTRTVPIRTVNYRTAAVAAAARTDAKTDEQTERLRQKCLALEKRNEEAEHQLQSALSANARLEASLNESRQVWQRERDSVTHKSRQDEKIRGVEIEALQQKFTSRMNIMETSNKSLHSQLVQTRRERDALRDSAVASDQKLREQLKVAEAECAKYAANAARLANIEKRLDESLATAKRLSSELALAKETHRADKKLWMIEKERLSANQPQANGAADTAGSGGADETRNRIAEDALRAAEDVQRQHAEYQKFYNKEVSRLKAKIKELNNQMTTKEAEFQRRAKELTEQIKILDIDQKNLVQVKEMQAGARDAMLAEQARLTQLLQQAEVHRISRRYRIASIVEQLNALVERRGGAAPVSSQIQSNLVGIVNQLNALKENDGVIHGQCPTATGETLSEADTTAPSDTVSQCSASVRSTPRPAPVHYANRTGGVSQLGTLTASQRSGSVESNTTWDSRLLDYTARSVSPAKRVFYADTLHSAKSGKPNYFARMGSSMCQDSYDTAGGTVVTTRLNLRQMHSMNALISGNDDAATAATGTDDFGGPHTRVNSTGTNVLYKIRRQELAKGTSPSVRSMALAFESIGTVDAKVRQKASPGAQLRGFFSIRKSRSVDNEAKKQKEFERSMTSALGRQAAGTVGGSAAGLSADGDPVLASGEPTDELSSSFTSTLPRGGRNPFKNMGARIVERVRRSLSRSSRQRDESVEKSTARPADPSSGEIREDLDPAVAGS